jgi:hypothetical protein
LLIASYLLFIAIAVLGSRANPEHWPRYSSLLLRLLSGGVAVAAGGIAVLLIPSDGAETTGRILLSTLLLGSIVYLSGLVLWRGTVAFTVRLIGWIILVIPALVPSTLSLALPALAILTLTISPVPSEGSSRTSEPSHAAG